MKIIVNSTMNKKPFLVRLKNQMGFQLMVLPALIFTIIFSYIPMGGVIIAFKNYRIRVGILGSDWVGLDNFKALFNDHYMLSIIRNTVGIGIFGIITSFAIVITFTLLLNEITNIRFKRVVQTVSYLPHFVSWAIMVVIMNALLAASDGILNVILQDLGILKAPINLLTDPKYYWSLAIFSDIWKEMGWSAIVYLAVIAGIDDSLYEAAKIDGAGRFSRIRYITLPALKGIISIMLILSVSSIPSVGFDQAYFLSNSVNFERANVLSFYIYQTGIKSARFSYSAAIGLILSLVSATLMIVANFTSKKMNGRGLY